MKKIFLFAAAFAASMGMMAQQPAVEFHYLPTEDGHFNTTDKVNVPADTVFIAGTNFTVKNAYATSYKVVGVMADTAYNTLMIGDQEVDFKTQRIQGQDNPKDAAGGNPATSLNVPTQGACYKVEVNQAGYLLVAVKSTPNKNQFAYGDITGAGAAMVGTPYAYGYFSMSNNTTGTAVGNPDGCLQIYVKGDEFNELHTSPETPASLYGSNYSTNGMGVMAVAVDPNMSPYLIGTGGSKMMAVGFAFVAKTDPNFANLTVVAKGCVDKSGNPHSDVTLYDANIYTNPNVKVQDCSEALKEVTITAYMPDAWMADSALYTAKELTKKFGCYVWDDNSKLTPSIHEMTKDKNVIGKYTYTAKYKESEVPAINAIFVKGYIDSTLQADSTYKYTSVVNWNGDANQTKDIKGINADVCYDVIANAGAKADAVLDGDCDPTTALDEVEAAIDEAAAQGKFINNGHLYIKKGNMIYDAAGKIVK